VKIVHLPSLLIGLLMAAYWMRVMHLVRKARRRAGHAANLIPRETIGRYLRLVWFPVVAMWIALPILYGLCTPPRFLLHPFCDSPALAWIAAFVALAAFVATLICWKKMGKSWRMGIDPHDQTELIITGPYAYLRHPIYALSSVLMLTTLAACPSPLMALVAVLHLLLLQWEARREEKYLLSIHGQAYRDYMQRTGRFIPQFKRLE